jgi:hypothetical protein
LESVVPSPCYTELQRSSFQRLSIALALAAIAAPHQSV